MKNINRKRVHWQANVVRHRFARGKPLSDVVPVEFDGSIYNMMMVRHVRLQL